MWYLSPRYPVLLQSIVARQLGFNMATPLKRKTADIASSTAKKPKVNASITSFFSSPSATTKSGSALVSKPSSTISSSPPTVTENDSSEAVHSTAATSASVLTVASTVPSAAPAPKFDKAKWVEKLTPDQKELLALEIESMDESWLAQLKDDVLSKDFLDLKRFLKKEHEAGKKIFPPAPDVYSW